MNKLHAAVTAIAYHLPSGTLTNEELAKDFPEWTAERIQDKTGINIRHVVQGDECASDLAVKAAEKLFRERNIDPKSLDFLLLCTQSPDYFLPTTACILQDRLGLPTTAGALDFNLGCSGFIYGLGLAKGLVETGQARRVLLITAETYSKHIHPQDRSVRTIFGDAAAATLIEAIEGEGEYIGPFVYGTDGRGAPNLIVPSGGMRTARSGATAEIVTDESGNIRSRDNLFMNGPEIFTFTMDAVPSLVAETIEKAELTPDLIDHYVFHQANGYMLNFLRKKARIPKEKFVEVMNFCGNTVSSTIPIALSEMDREKKLKQGQTLLLVGFGVGYSWGACVIRWSRG